MIYNGKSITSKEFCILLIYILHELLTAYTCFHIYRRNLIASNIIDIVKGSVNLEFMSIMPTHFLCFHNVLITFMN